MGIIGTAYGCIFSYVGGQSNPHFRSRTIQNEEAIRSLPEADEYPKPTRNMFSITAMAYPEPGLYKYQMVHFGLSLKDTHEYWDIWMRKFERLLTKMYWTKAELRLELEARQEQRQTCFDFRWEVPREATSRARDQWLRIGELPYSGSRKRCEEWAPVGEQELKERPKDTELMQQLVDAYQRLGEDEKARDLYVILRELDPERARNVEWI